MTRLRALALGLVAAIVLPAALAAQRGEIVVHGGIVNSPDEEFDRAISTQLPPPFYTRQRGVRESKAAIGVTASFAIRGHVFGELGVMRHGVERSISRTGLGDPDGPFLITLPYDGSITTFWLGPSYRFVDRERVAIAGVAAPMVVVMGGDAYDREFVFENAPSRTAAIGMLFGLRARVWITERLGGQLSLENAVWTMPLSPHPTDDTPFYPDTYRSTPRQHDLRLLVGAAYKLF